MEYRKEILSEEFTKHILDFQESKQGILHTAIHHFTGPDKGLPHDHPFSFYSHILKGGYIERIYTIQEDGSYTTEDIHRKPGTCHYVDAKHIHEIIYLPEEECWTLTVLGPHERDWRFWDFQGEIKSRVWFENEFTPYKINNINVYNEYGR